jgi:TetR/AcrR family transcriptional regulator, transcriptional repressor for nem operon
VAQEDEVARPSLRDRIVDAALDRFHLQGFSGCSVQDITDAAGVPKGSFYNHFKTKESLALEVLSRYREESKVEMLFEGAGPPLERLRRHFEFLAKKYEDWGFNRGCVVGNFGSDMCGEHPAMRAAICDGLNGWTTAIAKVLSEAQADGTLSANKDPETVARFLINAWQGAITRQSVVKNRSPFDDFFEVAFGNLLV